jgi:hypothetical protein
MLGAVSPLRVPRALRPVVLALVIGLGALTGCGDDGATSCGTNGCTVTFPRSGPAEVSVLGVTARLVRVDADVAQVEAAARVGARVCEVHTGPYAHAFHVRGRDAQSAPVQAELAKIAQAGAAIRRLGMRFNAGHALNYVNVQPVAMLPGVRELHIGHSIVARAVFVGLREAVREMKALMREAARAGAGTPAAPA